MILRLSYIRLWNKSATGSKYNFDLYIILYILNIIKIVIIINKVIWLGYCGTKAVTA